MNVQDRLLLFLKHKKLSKLAFANSIGRSPAYVTNIVESIGRSSRERIVVQYPELNMEWLLTGSGEMLNVQNDVDDLPLSNSEKGQDDAILIPLLPISAQAGRLTDFSSAVAEWDCEKIISPVKYADLAISIAGESMAPEYTSGTKVLVRKINDKAFIDWGKTYVLDTCNGTVIKNIYPSENPNNVKCVSVNPNYPPFDINKDDIYGWYLVLMSLSMK